MIRFMDVSYDSELMLLIKTIYHFKIMQIETSYLYAQLAMTF